MSPPPQTKFPAHSPPAPRRESLYETSNINTLLPRCQTPFLRSSCVCAGFLHCRLGRKSFARWSCLQCCDELVRSAFPRSKIQLHCHFVHSESWEACLGSRSYQPWEYPVRPRSLGGSRHRCQSVHPTSWSWWSWSCRTPLYACHCGSQESCFLFERLYVRRNRRSQKDQRLLLSAAH